MTFASHVKISPTPIYNESGELVRNEYYCSYVENRSREKRFLIASSPQRALSMLMYLAVEANMLQP